MKLDLRVYFGFFEVNALPWAQNRLLELKFDPFTSKVRFKYT